MIDQRWQKMWALFHELSELEAEERTRRLTVACAGDEELRGELEELLEAYEPARERFESGGLVPPAASSGENDLLIGDSVGPYRLCRLLGEGGMGVVFEAEQERPVARRVALKLMLPGIGSREMVARFESERQSLALMQHPAIAAVFDAGATEDGRPYFVMELVGGEPITRFCDERSLRIEERLRLFVQVCAAVQHAHQRGIIHRDLKPSNILVTEGEEGPGQPKVIDFGVAKATGPRPPLHSLATRRGVAVGTPGYMSPEQAGVDSAEAADVDTRSDVYSLGVVLYELLVGALPGKDWHHPPTPSARLRTLGDAASEVAARRGVDVAGLRRRLSGELEWILSKALEADRERRYGSAAELAADVERHLADEPLSVGPPELTYLLGKFVRRHRLMVVMASALLAALLLGLLGTTWMALVAERERRSAEQARDEARREAETARAINHFIEEMLAAPDPKSADRAAGVAREVKVAEVLDRAAQEIDDSLADRPAVRGALHQTLGKTYLGLGRPASAEAQLRAAYDLRRGLFGERDRRTLQTAQTLGSALMELARYDEAEQILRSTLELHESLLGAEHEETMGTKNSLATLLALRGRLEASESLFTELLEASRRVLGEDSSQALMLQHNVASIARRQGEYERAVALFEEALAAHRRHRGSEAAETLSVWRGYADALLVAGEVAAAEVEYEALLPVVRRQYGERHPDTLLVLNSLGAAAFRRQDFARAEEFFRESMLRSREVLGADHPETVASYNNLARSVLGRGEAARALEMYEQFLPRALEVLPEEHINHALFRQGYGLCLQELGRLVEAEGELRFAVEHLERTVGPEHPRTVQARQRLEALERRLVGELEVGEVESW